MLNIFNAQTEEIVYHMDGKAGIVHGRIPERTREAQAVADSIMGGEEQIKGYNLMLGEGIGMLAEELAMQSATRPVKGSCIELNAGSIN